MEESQRCDLGVLFLFKCNAGGGRRKETVAAQGKAAIFCRGDEFGGGYGVRYGTPKITVFGGGI